MVYKLFTRYKGFIRFCMVALGYNIVAYLIYAGLVYVGCNYLLSSTVSFVLGVTLSYFMNKNLVFAVEQHNYRLLLRYVSFYLLLLGINLSMLHVLVSLLKVNPYLGQIVVTMIAALISYNTMRVLVFRRR